MPEAIIQYIYLNTRLKIFTLRTRLKREIAFLRLAEWRQIWTGGGFDFVTRGKVKWGNMNNENDEIDKSTRGIFDCRTKPAELSNDKLALVLHRHSITSSSERSEMQV